MATEIERKWLVPELPPELAESAAEHVRQGYLAIGADGSEVRIRNKRDRFLLTVKSGGGLVRSEHEIEISSDQFLELWGATEGRRVTKRRMDLDGGRVIVDVYEGELAGLIVAEAEFDSESAAAAYETPAWFGDEVTEDRAYKNQNLALRGLPARD